MCPNSKIDGSSIVDAEAPRSNGDNADDRVQPDWNWWRDEPAYIPRDVDDKVNELQKNAQKNGSGPFVYRIQNPIGPDIVVILGLDDIEARRLYEEDPRRIIEEDPRLSRWQAGFIARGNKRLNGSVVQHLTGHGNDGGALDVGEIGPAPNPQTDFGIAEQRRLDEASQTGFRWVAAVAGAFSDMGVVRTRIQGLDDLRDAAMDIVRVKKDSIAGWRASDNVARETAEAFQTLQHQSLMPSDQLPRGKYVVSVRDQGSRAVVTIRTMAVVQEQTPIPIGPTNARNLPLVEASSWSGKARLGSSSSSLWPPDTSRTRHLIQRAIRARSTKPGDVVGYFTQTGGISARRVLSKPTRQLAAAAGVTVIIDTPEESLMLKPGDNGQGARILKVERSHSPQ